MSSGVPDSPERGGTRPRVVVIGGGFGGLVAARELAGAQADVVVVDRMNHHLFQPMLYQVATGIVSDGEIAPSLRGIFRGVDNVEVRLAEVDGIDVSARAVHALAPDGDAVDLPFDYLIVAAGGAPSYFGHDEWARVAGGMKSLQDAHGLRTGILGAFEMAADATDEAERDEWLTFVIVGAGPTGVELTGQIAELSRRLLRHEFTSIDTAKARIVLLDAGPTVLGPFAPRLQQYAERDLRKLAVEIRTSTKVTAIDERGVEVEDDHGQAFRIPARTVVWAAGVKASPLARILAKATGAEADKAGRVSVEPDCSLPGHPEVFAVGDMVSLNGLPGVAQPAIQEGRYAARTIKRRLAGDQSAGAPFHYFDKGTMAAIGRRRAVADAFGMKIGGPIAAVLWAMVHLMYLVGWGNRVGTVLTWAWEMLTRTRRELCIADTEALAPGRPERPARPAARHPAAVGGSAPQRDPAPPHHTGGTPKGSASGRPRAHSAPVRAYDEGGKTALEVFNRLDRVVLQLSHPDGRSEAEPIHPADAREIADALRRAADTAEQTPPTPARGDNVEVR